MAERTRQPSRSGDQSADLVPGQRSFDEHAVADILRRAAALEKRHPGGLGELTQDELEEIARDSGIEPSLVRRAIQERDEQAVPSTGSWLAGAPLQRLFERTVDVELQVSDHEALAEELRDALAAGSSSPLQLTVMGRSLTCAALSSGVLVEVSISPRGEQTRLRLKASGGNLAGGLFGGLMGGIGGGLGTNVGWMTTAFLIQAADVSPLVAVPAGLAAFLGVTGAAWALARALFSARALPVHRRLAALAERLEDRLRGRAQRGGA